MYSVYFSASTQEKNATVLPGKSEEDLMQQLVRDVVLELGQRTDQIEVFLNRPEMGLGEIIADSNQKKPMLHVALHSNAGGGSGTETWAYGAGNGGERDSNSVKFARLLQKKVVAVLDLPDRGVKDGMVMKFGEIVLVRATSVICEIFFHDNQGDVARYQERYPQVVDAVVTAVMEWFGVEDKKTGSPTVRIVAGGKVVRGCLFENRAWGPVREMAEALGFKVEWDGATKTVRIL